MSIDFAFSAMAARSDAAPAPWRRPFLKWLDGMEAGWAVPLLLAGFTAIWMAFLSIAYLSGDLHPDTLESWSLGRSWGWGNAKHPPLMGWIARAWTMVFPLTDWSFQLLAMTNSAIALWSVDLISRRFASGDKRVVVLLLLMLLPAYQFHAQRFNANTVLLATWPLAIYCFLRSFETRQIVWAAVAGAAAAVAMLGKYYSIFLIASFIFAAAAHPQRRLYFASYAPWTSTAAGLAVLGPHLFWLTRSGAEPFEYAIAAHGGVAFHTSLMEALNFLLGLAAAMAIPAVTWVMIAGYRLRRFFEDFSSMNPALLLLFLISVGTVAFPVVTAAVLGTHLPSLWALQGLFLFWILIVGGAGYPIERFYCVNLAVLVIGIALVAAIVAAPIHAAYRNSRSFEEGRSFYRLSAFELTRRWHKISDKPLSVVSGDDALALATSFYSPDHPLYARQFGHPYTPELPPASARERGWAALCFAEQDDCIEWMKVAAARVPRFIRSEFMVQSTLLGWLGATRGVTALFVPPQKEDTITPSPANANAPRFQLEIAAPDVELAARFHCLQPVCQPLHSGPTFESCWCANTIGNLFHRSPTPPAAVVCACLSRFGRIVTNP